MAGMDHFDPTTPIRIARPSTDLDAAEDFWVNGVGLSVLWRTDTVPAGHHELLMVGHPEARWHLELVLDPDLHAAHPPSPEDLLVLYLGAEPDPAWTERIEQHGGRAVPARNPYWDTRGRTFTDPDGYLLVLSHRTWG